MTETEAIILGAYIGFAGAVVGGLLGILGTLKITDRERHIKDFNSTACLLRNSLIKTQQRLATAKIDWSKPESIEDIAIGIIKEDFLIHDELARRFWLLIDKDSGFTNAWNNYQYWYYKVACMGTTDKLFPEQHPLKDDLGYQETLKANPYGLIQQIIENAKNK